MSGCIHDWQRQGAHCNVIFVIDDWQGPTDAIVQCGGCDACALLRMLFWQGRNLSTRIFAAAGLDSDSVAIFLRNMRSAYCDLSRHSAETGALIATAGPVDCGLVARVPDMEVLAPLTAADLGKFTLSSWRDQAPDEADPFWLALLSRHGIPVG